MINKSTLESLTEKVLSNLDKFRKEKYHYFIPDIWLPENYRTKHPQAVNINPAEYYSRLLEHINKHERIPLQRPNKGNWSPDAVIYNLFIRSACAFDHDQNRSVDLPLNKEGWRETGTFLKAMTLIPYIRFLGANTIHLLPVTSIGSDGNKGTLGSPYAIKNPYRLDENLHEPYSGLTAEEEFRLFVSAAHHLGMRVVVEFVFRTASKDSEWIQEQPDWFYWIRENIPDRTANSDEESTYGNPVFTNEELINIKSDIEKGIFDKLKPPHPVYQAMFTDPPAKNSVTTENGRFIGRLTDGTRVRIPGAFSDWPPDDTQPPWGDVTYLKMYAHPDFNYIAYNTIRMYDSRLAKPKNAVKNLWKKIIEILPYYQHSFGIDGVMIDMGHALPMALKSEIIKRARSINPDFAFWDENFAVTKKSVDEGYDAVIGYQWCDQHHPKKFQSLLKRFVQEGYPLPFFATPESHNTPRAAVRDGGLVYSKFAWAVGCFIPAIPFIHSGFEIGEKMPINTGLDFTPSELKKYPSENLPLFSQHAYNWLGKEQIRDWIVAIGKIRDKYKIMITDRSVGSFKWIETGNDDIICFIRLSTDGTFLIITANSNMHHIKKYSFNIKGISDGNLIDLISGIKTRSVNGIISGSLKPGDVMVFAKE